MLLSHPPRKLQAPSSKLQAPSSKLQAPSVFLALIALSRGTGKIACTFWRGCFRFTLPLLVEVQRTESTFNSGRGLTRFRPKNDCVKIRKPPIAALFGYWHISFLFATPLC